LSSASLLSLNRVNPDFANLESLQRGATIRLYQYARALDVFVAHPIVGAGPGIGYRYLYSWHTLPVVSAKVKDVLPEDNNDIGAGFSGVPLFRDNIWEDRMYSLHGVPFNFVIDLGVLGVVFLIYLLCRLFKMVRLTLFLVNVRYEKSTVLSFAVIVGTTAAILLSTLSTAKFAPYWFFAILIKFTEILYENGSQILHEYGSMDEVNSAVS